MGWCLNSHNLYVWSHDNPRSSCVYLNQHCFSINVWADIISDFFIGSYILSHFNRVVTRFDGCCYSSFHTNTFISA
ncbi:hypothetical protein X975_20320, partial [Stegodyphus mimosarum]